VEQVDYHHLSTSKDLLNVTPKPINLQLIERGGAIMNLAIKKNKNSRKLFSIKLRNQVTKGIIVAVFYEPRKERKYLKESKSWIVLWMTRVWIKANSKILRNNSLPGTTWLSSFMLAIESLRILIPFEEEEYWLDESGLPSWLIVPKTIDVSWGHELHRKLADQVNSEVAKFVEQIDKKRRRHQSYKKV
jgi:hypothetical protein